MQSRLACLLLCFLAGHAPGLLNSQSTSPKDALTDFVLQAEEQLDARIGIAVHQPSSGWSWSHRGDERFPMASTFKPLLCAAVLDAAKRGDLKLDQTLRYSSEQVLDYSPLTKDRSSIRLDEACAATLSHSDNTAANLALAALGGPTAVTAFLRTLGDATTRLDRWEPELNESAPGDPRDTTTPQAIVTTLESITLGRALGEDSRRQLVAWMEQNTVSDALLRSVLPDGWTIADRSGAGNNGTRNIVALVHDEHDTAAVIAIFITTTQAEWDQRNTAVASIGEELLAALP